jgi:hypothetical protein
MLNKIQKKIYDTYKKDGFGRVKKMLVHAILLKDGDVEEIYNSFVFEDLSKMEDFEIKVFDENNKLIEKVYKRRKAIKIGPGKKDGKIVKDSEHIYAIYDYKGIKKMTR